MTQDSRVSPLASGFVSGSGSASDAPSAEVLLKNPHWELRGASPGGDSRVGEWVWRYRKGASDSTLKAQVLCALHRFWIQAVSQPFFWREFSRSPEALALRKAHRFGAAFNELGEELQMTGLMTQDLGPSSPDGAGSWVYLFADPAPRSVQLLGQTLWDYAAVRTAPTPRALPFSLDFECMPESALPRITIRSRFEGVARELNLSEALAISGVPASVLEAIVFRTTWSAGLMAFLLGRSGLKLKSGVLQWGLDVDGRVRLLGVQAPDLFGVGGNWKLESVRQEAELPSGGAQAAALASLFNHLSGRVEFAGAPDWLEVLTAPTLRSIEKGTPRDVRSN
jgi:hypothetical protein